MFFLDEQNCKLSGFNPRAEFNGPDEKRSAGDLSIETKMSNDVLSMFDPKLKAAFYEKDNEDQGELIDAPHHLTKLRFPLLQNTMKWGEEFSEQTIIVNYGIGGPSDIKLIECKVKKFVFEFQEGGTVHMSFSVQAHPDQESAGKLCSLIQQEVKISIRPPNDAEKSETAERTAAREKLHDLFAPGDGPPDPNDDSDPREEDPLAGSDLAGASGTDSEDPQLYEKAKAFIAEGMNAISVSIVRRHFKIETLVAMRILETLEEDGLIGPASAQGLHDVLATA